MSKSIDLKSSLACSLFGNSAETSSRTKTWAAALALTVAGLTATNAIAATTPATDKNNDRHDGAESTDAKTSEGQAKAGQEVHKFDIPAGTVGEVIAALRKQAGIRIALKSVDKMADIASPGVKGVVTVEDAFVQALANTGLAARFDMPDSVMIDVKHGSETVSVTADVTPNMKFTAELRDLPATVSVVTSETMQYTASTTLSEALRTVPGITFGAGEGGNPLGDRPFIRGMDSQSSTYIDGMRDVAAQTRETFDVDSIEVQAGPGGAYGGRGTGGGSININTKIAKKDHFIAGSFTPGTSNYKRFTIDGNSKLNSYTYGRLVGLWHDSGVAGRDGVHTGRWGFAPSIVFGLGHPTRLYLDYYHIMTNNIPDSGIPYNNPTSTNGTTLTGAKFPRLFGPGDGTPIALPYRNVFYGLVDRDHDNEYAKIATGRVEHDLWNGHALLRSTFRYERTSQDYIVTLPDDSQSNLYYGLVFRRINSKLNAVFTDDSQTDLSGTVKTGKISHAYATGFEFSKERTTTDTLLNSTTYYTATAVPAAGKAPTGTETCQEGPGAASAYNCTSLFAPNMNDPWVGASATALNGQTYSNFAYFIHSPSHASAVTKGVYGFDTMTFNRHFQATVGGRFDNYVSQARTSPSATTTPNTTFSVENNLGTYIVGLAYKPNHATTIYGNVSTAAIPTGNSLGQGTDVSSLSTVINSNLQPETIREEEVGVKHEMKGGALARIAVYREDIQNVRIVADSLGNVTNGGTNRTIGLEASISGQVTPKWYAMAGYAYIDAILTQTAFGAPSTGATSVAGGTNGQHMPNTPWSSFSTTTNYLVLPKLRVGGGVYSNSMVWGSQPNNKWVRGYVRTDLFASYEINKHASLQGNALNIGDKVYYQQAYATHYAILAPGRTIQMGLNVKF